MQIDRNLIFNEYVSSLCKKAGKKLSVLPRLTNFMSIKQRRVLMKSFIESQFGCYCLIWLFNGRGVNNNSSFKELLKNDNSFTVHQRNIQSLTIELFKVKENLSNTIMNDILQIRTLIHNLRQIDFARSFIKNWSF